MKNGNKYACFFLNILFLKAPNPNASFYAHPDPAQKTCWILAGKDRSTVYFKRLPGIHLLADIICQHKLPKPVLQLHESKYSFYWQLQLFVGKHTTLLNFLYCKSFTILISLHYKYYFNNLPKGILQMFLLFCQGKDFVTVWIDWCLIILWTTLTSVGWRF